jgi:hypothetical protein
MSKRLSIVIITLIYLTIITCDNLGQNNIHNAEQATYNLGPVNGDDNNNSVSISSAFKTIVKAQKAVRSKNKKMTGDILIYHSGGTFYIYTEIDFFST